MNYQGYRRTYRSPRSPDSSPQHAPAAFRPPVSHPSRHHLADQSDISLHRFGPSPSPQRPYEPPAAEWQRRELPRSSGLSCPSMPWWNGQITQYWDQDRGRADARSWVQSAASNAAPSPKRPSAQDWLDKEDSEEQESHTDLNPPLPWSHERPQDFKLPAIRIKLPFASKGRTEVPRQQSSGSSVVGLGITNRPASSFSSEEVANRDPQPLAAANVSSPISHAEPTSESTLQVLRQRVIQSQQERKERLAVAGQKQRHSVTGASNTSRRQLVPPSPLPLKPGPFVPFAPLTPQYPTPSTSGPPSSFSPYPSPDEVHRSPDEVHRSDGFRFGVAYQIRNSNNPTLEDSAHQLATPENSPQLTKSGFNFECALHGSGQIHVDEEDDRSAPEEGACAGSRVVDGCSAVAVSGRSSTAPLGRMSNGRMSALDCVEEAERIVEQRPTMHRPAVQHDGSMEAVDGTGGQGYDAPQVVQSSTAPSPALILGDPTSASASRNALPDRPTSPLLPSSPPTCLPARPPGLLSRLAIPIVPNTRSAQLSSPLHAPNLPSRLLLAPHAEDCGIAASASTSAQRSPTTSRAFVPIPSKPPPSINLDFGSRQPPTEPRAFHSRLRVSRAADGSLTVSLASSQPQADPHRVDDLPSILNKVAAPAEAVDSAAASASAWKTSSYDRSAGAVKLNEILEGCNLEPMSLEGEPTSEKTVDEEPKEEEKRPRSPSVKLEEVTESLPAASTESPPPKRRKLAKGGFKQVKGRGTTSGMVVDAGSGAHPLVPRRKIFQPAAVIDLTSDSDEEKKTGSTSASAAHSTDGSTARKKRSAAPFRQRSYDRSYTFDLMLARPQRPRGSSYPLPRRPFAPPPSPPSPSSSPALPSYVDYDASEATSGDPFPTSLCYGSDPTPPTRHALTSTSEHQATNTPANGSAVAGEPQSKKRARSESPVVAHLEELRKKKRARSMGVS